MRKKIEIMLGNRLLVTRISYYSLGYNFFWTIEKTNCYFGLTTNLWNNWERLVIKFWTIKEAN